MSTNKTTPKARDGNDNETRRRSGWATLVAVLRAVARCTAVVWRFSSRHPWACTTTPIVPAAVWFWGPVPVAVSAVVAAGAAGWCWWDDRDRFRRQVTDRVRTGWRWEWIYHRRWTEATALNGLARMYKAKEIVPRLEKVRCSWAADVLTIREAPGQAPDMWENKAPDLAETFGALSGRVRRIKPGKISLELITHRDTGLVAPLPITPADQLDLGAVPVALLGNGEPWCLPVQGLNHEVIGRQGAGKTAGAAWSIIRGVAAGIGTGEVVIWAGDPTRGAGLAHGPKDTDGHYTCPLFARIARSEPEVAEMVFDAVELMYQREEQLYIAGQRRYEPSTEMPTVIMILDELLSLTQLLKDRQLAAEIAAEIPLLLSRARKVGIVAVVLSQDGRDRALPAGDLIQVPICMGVKRAALVDVVLGQGAHALGAHAERIPKGDAGAGQAFVLSDDDSDGDVPLWVRFSHIDRACADEMGLQYPTPWAWNPEAGLHRRTEADTGQVVDITARLHQRDALTAPPASWAVDSAGRTQPAADQEVAH